MAGVGRVASKHSIIRQVPNALHLTDLGGPSSPVALSGHPGSLPPLVCDERVTLCMHGGWQGSGQRDAAGTRTFVALAGQRGQLAAAALSNAR